MVKKIIGGLFVLVAILILVGSIANGSFMNDRGSAAATYGAFLGTLISIVFFTLSGIFLFFFDRIYNLSYLDGFKARKKQCIKIILFVISFAVLGFFAGIGSGSSGSDNSWISLILYLLPFFVPMMVFALMISLYVIPYFACKKHFKLDEALLNEYLSNKEAFRPYTENASVLASDAVLFFPKNFCIIPFEQIASIKFYNSLEQDVIFSLKNGKKIEIVAGKKVYDAIATAIEDHNKN